MKNQSNGEKIVVTIVLIIIFLVIAYVIYTVFSSNTGFLENKTSNNNISNESNENMVNKDENTDTNNDTSTQDVEDNMNVNEDIINNISKPPKETEIATYTSTLYDRDNNRVDNIGLAISKLNGKIVKKDEEFSFNNTIGPMDESNGFKKAVGFDTNGNKIKMSGGGLCQISSTMYNAVLIANLEVTERHPHSRRVYYVPKDKDATIYYGSLDFKFKNTSGSDIRIDASNTNTDVTIKLIKLEQQI